MHLLMLLLLQQLQPLQRPPHTHPQEESALRSAILFGGRSSSVDGCGEVVEAAEVAEAAKA